ncbi:hypothetical protein FBU30_007038 [Linnemannia zychae]|nr:hypothetical protein FBU30_007038 [Linnemannia zychae]
MAIGLTTITASEIVPLPSTEADTSTQVFGLPHFYTNAIRGESYAEAVAIPVTVEFNEITGICDAAANHPTQPHYTNRAASMIPAAGRGIYTWDFETYSQNNFIGDRQRFNGGGCVNFRCSEARGYKGLPDKEYTFYKEHDCHGDVLLKTKEVQMDNIKQPFNPCSIDVKRM